MKIFIFCSLLVLNTSSHSAPKSAIDSIWLEEEYSDPINNSHLRYKKIDNSTLKALLSKVDSSANHTRIWEADINNDGRQEYIFLRTPLYKKDGTEDGRKLDRVGPIFSYENGTLVEIKMPTIPFRYTNILLPFLDHGKHGVEIKLHYRATVNETTKGNRELVLIGNEANSEKGSFVVSHKATLLWKGDSIKILKEKHYCTAQGNEKICNKHQMAILKRVKLPAID